MIDATLVKEVDDPVIAFVVAAKLMLEGPSDKVLDIVEKTVAIVELVALLDVAELLVWYRQTADEDGKQLQVRQTSRLITVLLPG